MARQVVVTPVDDLDGTVEDVQTVSFTWGKAQYDVELGKANRDKYNELMAPLIKVARKRRGNPSRTGRLGYGMAKEIRNWYIANGVQVAPTGRLSEAQIARYFRENPERLRK